MKKITLLLLLLTTGWSYSQANAYLFSQSTTTYTEINGGTLLGAIDSDDQRFVDPSVPLGGTTNIGVGLPIGFQFTFNGFVYDRFAVNNNGWISLGSSALSPSVNINSTSNYVSLESTVATASDDLMSRISALGKDLQAQVGATLTFETIGTAPNRTLVVQWKGYKKFSTNGTGDNFNFQIRLNETSNTVDIVYGQMVSNANANQIFQVGLRTAPATLPVNFTSRTSATSWSATTPSTAVTDGILMSNVIFPASGLKYTFAPPACNAPSALVSSMVTNTTATIGWTALTPTPDAYQYIVSSSSVLPTGSGTATSATTADLTLLVPNTLYYVYLRADCGSGFSIWSMAGTFKTQCDPATGFVENFDSTTLTGAANPMTDCWDRAGNGSTYITTASASPMSAPNKIYMSSSFTAVPSTQAYALMPPVSNLQAATHRLRFRAYASAASKILEVGYFATPNDIASFVLIETVNLPATAATAAEFVIIPSALPAGVGRLVFRCAATAASTTLYIDNVSWEPIPACADTTGLTAGNTLSNSIDLTWEPANSVTAWQYAYGATTVTDPNTLPLFNVADNPETTVVGLDPSTTYKIWIRSNCGVDGFGVWADPITVTTTCAPVAVFSENFDTLTTGTTAPMPTCWTKFGTSGGATVYPTTGGVLPGTAPNRLHINTTASATSKAFVVLPPVSNLQAGTHRLKFRAFATTVNKVLEVGYFENSANAETFIVLESLNMPSTAASTAKRFFITPANVPAGVESLVLRLSGTTVSATQIYVDDFGWEAIPPCGDITGLNVNEITATSALVYWEPGDSVTAWQYVYGVATVTDPATLTPVDVTSNPFDTIEGLQHYTAYKYWVRSNCNGAFGLWSDPFTFTTLCGVVVPAYTQDFAVFPPGCWTRAAAGTPETGPTGTAAGIWVADGFLNSGTTGAIKVNLYGLNRIGWMISPTIDLSGPEDYTVNFDYAVTTWNATTPAVMGTDDTVKLLISEDNGATWTEMISLDATDNISNTVQNASLEISSTSATTKFAFWTTDGALDEANDYDFFIDNFSILPIPDCAAPSSVTAGPVFTNTATITWNASITPPANGYEYYVNTVNETPAANVIVTGAVAAGVLTADLINLIPNTTYYVWVRSVCSGVSDSDWSVPASFKTDCATVTAFAENFDSYTSTGSGTPMPDCWKRAGNALTYIITASVAPGTPPNRLYMAGNALASAPTESLAIMPPVSNLQAGTHRLKFSAYATSVNKFVEVGYLGDAADISTFILLETIDLPGTTAATAENFSITPQGVPSGITTFAFRNPGASGGATILYIDNVVWEVAPACPDVNGLAFNGATATTADISWNPGGSETAWEYVYGATTVTDPNTLTAFEVLNNPSTTIPSLSPATAYKVWVRSKCGAEVGVWSLPITFTTTCVAISTLPWTEGFEGITTVGTTAFPACWYKQNGDWSSAIADTYTTPKSGTKYVRAHWAATNEFMWTPGFELTAGVSYDFSFFAQGDGHNGWTVDLFHSPVQYSTAATQFGETYSPPGTGATAMQPYYEVTNTFVPATTGVYYFALRVNQPSSTPWYLAFDDFKLRATPSCLVPTAVNVDGVTSTGATVNWNASVTVPANGYQYYRATTNTPPTAGTTPTGSVGPGVTSIAFTDLTSLTTYFVWVRSFCGTDDYSEWTVAVSFTTPCIATDVPYNQNFESAAIGSIPSCTSVQNAGTGNNWNVQSVNANGFSSKVLRYAWNTTNAANTWFFTQGLNLTAGTEYKVTYKYGNNATTFTEKLRVSFGNSPLASSMTTELAVHPNVAGGVSQTNTVTFIPAQTGVYYVGFNAYSAVNQFYLYVDDIAVDIQLSVGNFNPSDFKAYPNPVKDILNLSYTQNISSVEIFNLLGQQVIVKAVNANQGQVDMSNLASGTYLVKVNADNQVKTIKVLKQ